MLFSAVSTSGRESSENRPSIFDYIRRAVQVDSLNFGHCRHEKSYARVNHIADRNSTLRDIGEAHYTVLVESFHNYNYDFVRSMMMVYLSSTVNLDGSTDATAVQSFDGRRLPKIRYCMFILDGRYRCCSVELLRDNNGMQYATEPMRMRCALRADRKATLQALEIKLNLIANISTAFRRRKATFTGTIQSLLSYARALGEHCGVGFDNVRISDIEFDMMRSNF